MDLPNVYGVSDSSADYDEEDREVRVIDGLDTPGPMQMLRSVNGEIIPVQVTLPTVRQCLQVLKTSRMDATDVLLCAYPKTGTHWHWEMLMMLIRGEAKHLPEKKDAAWIDVTPMPKIKAAYAAPRVMSTHLPFGHFSQDFLNGCKVVFLIRNPKDVFVSMFHHINIQCTKNKSLEEFFYIFLHSKYNWWGSYFDNLADMWDNHRDDPNILFLFFEDVKKNHRAALVRMASFLELDTSASLIDDIVSATGFSTMKEAKYSSETVLRQRFGQNSTFYRKGEVGDWKNYITVVQNEEMDRFIAEWNKDRQIPFIYE